MFAPVLRTRRLCLPQGVARALLLGPAVVGLALIACTGSTPPPSPTAKPVAKQATSTGSPAPKLAASPGASPQAKSSPSPAASTSIAIIDATLADATPWVSLRLADGEPIIVSGWRLEVGNQSAIIPGNAVVNPGDTLTLHAGDGLSSEREVFLGPDSYALALAASPGARVRLVNMSGEVVAETTVPRF